MPMPNQKTDPWKKERSRSGRKTRFFTLVELLVVISVLVILLSLLLPALKQSIEKGRSVSCIGNLRQVGAGVLQYTEEWNGYYTNRDSSARWANRGAMFLPNRPMRNTSSVSYSGWAVKSGIKKGFPSFSRAESGFINRVGSAGRFSRQT